MFRRCVPMTLLAVARPWQRVARRATTATTLRVVIPEVRYATVPAR
jgi:hypothetical protein